MRTTINRNRTGLAPAVALVLGVMLGLPTSAFAQSLLTAHGNVLAYPGGSVPGPSGAIYTGIFEGPVVADDGTLLFRARIDGGDVSGNANSRALFMGTSVADLSMLARWSDPAPALPGLSLINSGGTNGIQGSYRISPDGRTLWSSYLSGPGVSSANDSAMFGGPAASQIVLAREGDTAPGAGGAVFSGDRLPSTQFSAINRNGEVLFQSNLSGAGVTSANNLALFAGTPAALALVVRKGDTVLPGPVTASAFPGQTLMDGDGRVLYDLNLAGASVSTSNDASLWAYAPGSGNVLLAREGQSAPGTAGATFNDALDTWQASLSVGGLNGHGQFVMTSELQGGDVVGVTNDFALYAGSTSGGLTLVARRGDPAPGTDAVFDGFVTNLTFINNAGTILTVANLRGGTVTSASNSAVYTATPTGNPLAPYALSLVVRAGDPAPGAPGDVFGPVSSQLIAFNDLGQAAFNRDLQGPDVVSGINDRGVWGWDATHGVFLIGRAGDQLEVSPGVFFTPSTAGYANNGNTDGSALGLSKNGLLAMSVNTLEGGSLIMTVDLRCYPPTSYYTDADGDGYGDAAATPVSVCADATAPAGTVPNNTDCNDANPNVHPGAPDAVCDGVDDNCSGTADEGYVPVPTSCGVGACARTGATSCVHGTVVNGCTPGAPQPETCNGIDDNCDGTIDNAAVPSARPTMTLARVQGDTQLSWNASAAATAYDVVSGDLQELRGQAGDYAALTQAACTSNDLAATTLSVGSTPPPVGGGRFYLVRPVNCGGAGTYDDSPGLRSSRDAGITAGGWACP